MQSDPEFDQGKPGNVEQPDGTYEHDGMFPDYPEDHYFNSLAYADEIAYGRADIDQYDPGQ